MTNEEHCVEWLAQDDAVQPILSRCFADNGGVCDISWCVGWVGVDAARAEPPGARLAYREGIADAVTRGGSGAIAACDCIRSSGRVS